MPCVTLYHNPRCSKSREALRLLQEAGCEVTVVEYLKTPPSEAELDALLTTLGLEPRALMRQGEPEYAELYLDDVTLERRHLIQAMIQHPRLIERPIAIAGGHAVVARPPEKALELLPLLAE